MTIGVIDDEVFALGALIQTVQKTCPKAVIHGFCKARALLSQMRKTPLDIIFSDIEMDDMNGLELAKELKEIHPPVNIIFVTAHSQYALQAFDLRVSGYLMKPVKSKDIQTELRHLRNPLPPAPMLGRLRVQTFGNFEVFCNEERLHFSRPKAKELFAYLIEQRGAPCTMAELSAVLWTDKPYSRFQIKQLHTLLADLRTIFKNAGITDVLVKKRNSVSVQVNLLDCDYYRFLQGDSQAINSFTNEYMTNYSWAEFTVGALSSLSAKE